MAIQRSAVHILHCVIKCPLQHVLWCHSFILFLLSIDPPRKRIDSRSTSTPHLQVQRARYMMSHAPTHPHLPCPHTYTYTHTHTHTHRAQSTGSAGLDQYSPRSPRLSVTARPTNYSTSSGDYYTYSGASPGKGRKISSVTEPVGHAATLQSGLSPPGPPATAGAPWRRKLSQTMKHLTVSPRFHRKRYEGAETEASSPVM